MRKIIWSEDTPPLMLELTLGGFNGIITWHKIGLLLFAWVSMSWEPEVVVVTFDSDGTSNRLCGKKIEVRLSFEMIMYGNKLAFMGVGD